MAINQSGTVLGSSCFPNSPTCANFLWTPSSPNGNVGTTSAIPMPAGFSTMFTAALTASAQVVGGLWSKGAETPFLYAGATVYDLSTLGSQLAG